MVAFKNTYKFIKIYIKDKLHVCFKRETFIGFESWYDDGKYCIEYYFSDSGAILTEYDKKELFDSILKLLDENLN